MQFELATIEKQAVAEGASATALVDEVKKLPVTTEPEAAFGSKMVQAIKKQWKELDAQEKTATEPLKKTVATIQSWFKPAKISLGEAEEVLKTKLDNFLKAEAAKQRVAIEAAAKAVKTGDDAAFAVAMTAATPPPKIAGISTREIWRARVVDETKIPREFLCPDEKKLGDYAKAMKQNAKVEGVEFYPETSVASRASK